MDTFLQAERYLTLDTPLGPDALLVEGFNGQEELSKLFEFELDLLSQTESVDPNKIVGQRVTLNIQSEKGDPRAFDGFVSRFAAGGRDERGMRRYRLTMVPWLWFLTKTSDCRIYQEQTYPDIIKAIFDEAGFTDFDASGIRGEHPKHTYTVQYRESDFNFVSRLMEEEGIFYFFRHEAGKHTLVLADSKVAYEDSTDKEVPFSGGTRTPRHIHRWEHRYEFVSGKFAHTDYNFETPGTKLVGSADTVLGLPNATKYEVFDCPGGHLTKSDGNAKIRLRMEEEELAFDMAEGESDCTFFTPGAKFTLSEHEIGAEQGTSWVFHSVRHHAQDTSTVLGTGGDQHYENTFTCFPAEAVYRPPVVTEKPLVHGLETAVVVGPSGEEIHTDKYGRVKVQFHWDRYGASDDKSSCWIRVLQSAAGKGWGNVFLPRIGHEVVVDFECGDPDRPLVTGSVYHAENMPPYELPANKTRSTIKTRSTKGGGADNFNEIRFEDKKGEEELYIHAEKDQNVEVENDQGIHVGHDRVEAIDNDRTLSVGNDKAETVAKDKSIKVGGSHSEGVDGDMSVTVDKGRTLSVTKDLAESVGGDMTLAVSKDRSTFVDGKMTVTVGKDSTLTVSGKRNEKITKELLVTAKKIAFDAEEEIVMQAGDAKIKLKKNGDITIQGKKITVKGSGDVVLKGSKVTAN